MASIYWKLSHACNKCVGMKEIMEKCTFCVIAFCDLFHFEFDLNLDYC